MQFSRPLSNILECRMVKGSFEPDGTNDPVNVRGPGFTVVKVAATTGRYLVTCDQGFTAIEDAEAHIMTQASSGAAYATVIATDAVAGTITIEGHSSPGTEANLDGERIGFTIWARYGGHER